MKRPLPLLLCGLLFVVAGCGEPEEVDGAIECTDAEYPDLNLVSWKVTTGAVRAKCTEEAKGTKTPTSSSILSFTCMTKPVVTDDKTDDAGCTKG